MSETAAAKAGNYPNPVHGSYADTARSYDKNVNWLLQKIGENQSQDGEIRFVLGTVNQESILKAIKR